MSEFFVGQKVVCVRGPLNSINYNESQPSVGTVYTIRDLHPDGDAVRLKEIVNPSHHYRQGFHEIAFYLCRFRPLEPQAIALFRKIAQGVTDGKPIIADPEPVTRVLVPAERSEGGSP